MHCEETDYDTRGDCDGLVRIYWLRKYKARKIPGEQIALCASHARMSGGRREIGKKP